MFKVELEYSFSGATILNSRFTKLNKYFTETLLPAKRRGRGGSFRRSALEVQSTLVKTFGLQEFERHKFLPGKHHIQRRHKLSTAPSILGQSAEEDTIIPEYVLKMHL